ncbi:TetR/AcrR family transcriptional regulator [Acidicapsa acidisoli]|nr:TetR/AcrR family transcriptional regulator [Acidicapsa acidisoli]
MDEIAKQAGVGAGTLCRHFPTRDASIEGVYQVASSQPRINGQCAL